MASWKRDAVSGLVVLTPILVTLYIVIWLYSTISDIPLLKQIIRAEMFGGLAGVAELVRVVLTLLVFGALVLSIGYLMRTAVGRVLERAIDDLINQVPGLRVVYNASKMAVETTLSGASGLQTPVKLEIWEGKRITAFKTGKQTSDGREVVFMPTAPNITTGFVMEIDSKDIIETDERLEDALTRILSAGFGETRPDGVHLRLDESKNGDDDEQRRPHPTGDGGDATLDEPNESKHDLD